jgi:hypothetical protein
MHIELHLRGQPSVPGHLYDPSNDANGHSSLLAVTLDFVDQKNSKKGEKITQRATSHAMLCPAKAVARLVTTLVRNGANPKTNYHRYMHPTRGLLPVTREDIGLVLGLAARAVEDITGIDHTLITASSLRPGGATALLCAGINKDTIKLIGRWRSDAIDTYLRTTATILTSDHSAKMLEHGSYRFSIQDDAAVHGLPSANLPKEAIEAYFKEYMQEFTKSLAHAITGQLFDLRDDAHSETNDPE